MDDVERLLDKARKALSDSGAVACLEPKDKFNLPTSEPIDLLSGGLFLKCVDIRLTDPVSVSWLLGPLVSLSCSFCMCGPPSEL